MAIEINETVAQRLRDEQIIWFTTVRADGTPTPTPVNVSGTIFYCSNPIPG